MAAKASQSTPTKEISSGNDSNGSATGDPPPSDSNAPPSSSTATLTTARRMVTRGLGTPWKKKQEVYSTSNKRKLPSEGNHPAFKAGTSETPKEDSRSPKKGKVSPPELIMVAFPNSRVSPQKDVDSKVVQPQTKTSNKKGKLESAPRALDIVVRHTPSDSIPTPPLASHKNPKHIYISIKEVKELRQRATKAEKDVIRLRKDQKRLRMQVYRSNKRNERLEEEIMMEQDGHERVAQQLKAIMEGVQLEYVTAQPEAT